jgi:hypothetical protein
MLVMKSEAMVEWEGMESVREHMPLRKRSWDKPVYAPMPVRCNELPVAALPPRLRQR